MSTTTEKLLEAFGVPREEAEAQGEVVSHVQLTVAEVKELVEPLSRQSSVPEDTKKVAVTALQGIVGLADNVTVTMTKDTVRQLGGAVPDEVPVGKVSRLLKRHNTKLKSKEPDLKT